ncbi:O-antigen ligase family protein [Candidatus Omnitrophota bacterium]
MNRSNIVIIILTLLFGLLIAALPTLFKSPTLTVGIVLGLVVCLVTLINTEAGLIVLIFSMLLSPEIEIAQVPSRAVVVRIDDILLLVIFFTWLAKTAVNKELPLLRYTPVNLPIVIYIVICIVTSVKGAIVGTADPVKAMFYIIKYIEYFLVFFMVVNNLKSPKQVERFMALIMATCFIVCIVAWFQIAAGAYRVTAPFEGLEGEPNTFGGYLLFIWAIIFGIFWNTDNVRWKFFTGAMLFYIIPPFLYTLSRASYMGAVPMFLTFIILTEKGRWILIALLVIAVMAGAVFFPDVVKGRITQTFSGEEHKIAGRVLKIDGSAAARMRLWNKVMTEMWPKKPLFGFGSGYFLIDGQYLTVLAENGVAGLFVFVWIMMAIFREGMITLYKMKENGFARGVCLGFLAGMVGLLIHSITANSFIIVRIMEPFWFMTAIVVMLRYMYPQHAVGVKQAV